MKWLGLALILLALSKNIIYFPSFLRSMVTGHPPIAGEMPPGRDFLALCSYLKEVPVAGFFTDREPEFFWRSATAKRIYQQAQRALTPTLMDAQDPFRHPFVIFECQHAGCEKAFLGHHGLKVVVQINGNITLAQKAGAAL